MARLPRAVAVLAVVLLALFVAGVGLGQTQTPPTAAPADGKVMLTIFLRHDQSKTLDEINARLEATGFRQKFPPAGVEVVSWYVMMGIGQVVTVRLPPEKLREVNLAIEQSAWGSYRTEFYPTYDYRPIAEAERKGLRTKRLHPPATRLTLAQPVVFTPGERLGA